MDEVLLAYLERMHNKGKVHPRSRLLLYNLRGQKRMERAE